MKIEKLTENKIRIILKSEELSNKNVDLNDFFTNNIKSNKLILNILNKAEKELGFHTHNCKLLIEAFSSLDDFFVFTITKLAQDSNKKPKYYLGKSNKNLNTDKNISMLQSLVYQLDSFEEFCNLCTALFYSKIPIDKVATQISLYSFNNTYYIIFSNLNLTYRNFKKLFSLLSEFAILVTNCDNFKAKLIEYGKPIIKKNALKTGIKYFK